MYEAKYHEGPLLLFTTNAKGENAILTFSHLRSGTASIFVVRCQQLIYLLHSRHATYRKTPPQVHLLRQDEMAQENQSLHTFWEGKINADIKWC